MLLTQEQAHSMDCTQVMETLHLLSTITVFPILLLAAQPTVSTPLFRQEWLSITT